MLQAVLPTIHGVGGNVEADLCAENFARGLRRRKCHPDCLITFRYLLLMLNELVVYTAVCQQMIEPAPFQRLQLHISMDNCPQYVCSLQHQLSSLQVHLMPKTKLLAWLSLALEVWRECDGTSKAVVLCLFARHRVHATFNCASSSWQ